MCTYMVNKGNQDHFKRTQKDYSLAFKLKVIDEVEEGHLTDNTHIQTKNPLFIRGFFAVSQSRNGICYRTSSN